MLQCFVINTMSARCTVKNPIQVSGRYTHTVDVHNIMCLERKGWPARLRLHVVRFTVQAIGMLSIAITGCTKSSCRISVACTDDVLIYHDRTAVEFDSWGSLTLAPIMCLSVCIIISHSGHLRVD